MTDAAKHTMPAATAVLIGEPAVEPVALLTAIVAATDRLSAVRSLSRCWAQSGQEAPGLIVGVDLDPDDDQGRAAVVDAVSEAVSSSHPEFTVDVVFWADGGVFVEWMLQNVKPFRQHAA